MSDYSDLYMQKSRIEKLYNCFSCSVNGLTSYELVCRGELQPLDAVDVYKIEIRMRPKRKPVVRILSPKIKQSAIIHMYRDGSLCLYYPYDMVWKISTQIAEYTIPWLIEWILYYEIFKITGKWEGKEAPHFPT